MARVLVVDDEQSYRHNLKLCLCNAGHEVRTAADDRSAVEIAARYRPDVLITDWMLKCPMDGLKVASALRAYDSHVQTILITGFSSQDLRAEAERCRVQRYIEKPFDLDAIRNAVADVLTSEVGEDVTPHTVHICALELDGQGRILYANRNARRLLVGSAMGEDLGNFGDYFLGLSADDLPGMCHEWVRAALKREEQQQVWMRARAINGSNQYLLIMDPHDQTYIRHHPAVKMLLKSGGPAEALWPVSGHAVVIDAEVLIRNLVVTMLQSSGAICYSAESVEVGMRHVQRDPEMRVAVLGTGASDAAVIEMVRAVRAERPNFVFIGNVGRDAQDDLRQAGVAEFLPQPWGVSDLIDIVRRADERSRI
jgi:DNA-binding response OmpR family regulator